MGRAPLRLCLSLLASACGSADALVGPGERDLSFFDSAGHEVPSERVVALFEPQFIESGATELADGRVLVAGVTYEAGSYARAAYVVSLEDRRVEELPAPFSSTKPSGWLFGVARLDERRVLMIDARIGESESVVLDLPSQQYRALETPRIGGAHVVSLADARVLWTSGPRRSALFDPGSERWNELPAQSGSALEGTATLLSDGRVLVTSLAGDSVDDPAAAFVFSPAQQFQPIAPPLVNRENAGAVALPDGRVLLFGGQPAESGIDGMLDSTEIYDPATDRWVEGPRLGAPLAFGKGFSHAGDVYLVGGITEEPCPAADCGSERVHRLRPGAASFERAPDLHPASAGKLTVVRDGTAYLVSGMGIFRYALP